MNEQSDIGVGPHPRPWPTDDRYDSELLEHGDRRNVIDTYRYWKVEAIKADLDRTRIPLQIAVENVGRDFNMGTIIRSANAFNVRTVHIIGSRQWNKRGAMVTDIYMNIEYHTDVDAFDTAMRMAKKEIIAVDIVEGAKGIASVELNPDCVLVFGAEGPGLSTELLSVADQVVMIEQLGSTRSVNVGVAAGIAMYEWVRRFTLDSSVPKS
ncbi:MAG: TrmH family RNA methyltransferase [Candidatus Microsaccharimonas sp.]